MKRENKITGVITPSLAYLLDQATIVTDPDKKSHTVAFIDEELTKQFTQALSTKKIIPIEMQQPTSQNGMLYSILLEDNQLFYLKHLISAAKYNPVQPTFDNLPAISAANNTNDKELKNQWTDRNVTGDFSIIPFDVFKNHILTYLFLENLYELRLLNHFFYKLFTSFISSLLIHEDKQLIQYKMQKITTKLQEKLNRYELSRYELTYYSICKNTFIHSKTELDNVPFILFLNSVHFLTFMIAWHQQLDEKYITRWNEYFNYTANIHSEHFLSLYTHTQWNQHFVAKEFLVNYQLFKRHKENSKIDLLLFSPGHANFWQYFWLTLREINYLQEEFNNIVSFLTNFHRLKNKLSSTSDLFWKMFFKGISKLKSFKDTNYLLDAISKIDMTTALYNDKNFLEVFYKSMSSNGVASAVFFFRHFPSLKSKGLSSIFSLPSSCQFYFEACIRLLYTC